MIRKGGEGELWPFHRDEQGRLSYRGKLLPEGPWHAEPDRVELEQDGIPGLLLRGPMGAWCGYVGLPEGHPWIGVDLATNSHPANPWSGPEITYQRARPPGNTTPATSTKCEQWIGFSCIAPGTTSLEIAAILGRAPARDDYTELSHAEKRLKLLAALVLSALPN